MSYQVYTVVSFIFVGINFSGFNENYSFKGKFEVHDPINIKC